MSSFTHIPVLLDEVLEQLNPQSNQNFVDATLGGGGYTQAMLRASGPNGMVLAIDLDRDALSNAKSKLSHPDRLVLCHGNFSQIDHFVAKHEFRNISGIVADIGLSSYQIDQSGRGISFQRDELLDMRFDLSSTQPDARFLLNHATKLELAEIFKRFGEEKWGGKIAGKIEMLRRDHPINRTVELVDVIKSSLPKNIQHRWMDTARRIFQSLRIAVNHELENLENFLPKAFDLLAPGGVLAIVTFHSLEDRIIKQYFRELSKGCVCPKEFPICKCGLDPVAKILTKKAVIAGPEEQSQNPRSKSAKLRAVQKL